MLQWKPRLTMLLVIAALVVAAVLGGFGQWGYNFLEW